MSPGTLTPFSTCGALNREYALTISSMGSKGPNLLVRQVRNSILQTLRGYGKPAEVFLWLMLTGANSMGQRNCPQP